MRQLFPKWKQFKHINLTLDHPFAAPCHLREVGWLKSSELVENSVVSILETTAADDKS